MGVREIVEKQRRWVVPLVSVIILACAVFIWTNSRGDQLPGAIERVYFSDDDGKTWFTDDASKGFTFDHDGKTAYRAFVYRCDSGAPFVGLLARTAEQPLIKAAGATDPRTKAARGPAPPMEFRKPGTTKWVLSTGAEAATIIGSLCPSGAPESVLP